MGLDVVELVMRVEEEFEIRIEDEEASFINTVGQLHTLILVKAGFLRSQRCPSSATFYQLRRGLIDLAVASRKEIAPATSIAALLPARQRRRIWNDWGCAVQIQLPDLEKPRWVRALCWLAVAASLAAGVLVWNDSMKIIVSYGVTVCAILTLTYRWSELRATELPANCASVGALTQAVMKLNYGINVEKGDASNAEEVWQKLKSIVVDKTGAQPDEVTPEADFIRDLNFG